MGTAHRGSDLKVYRSRSTGTHTGPTWSRRRSFSKAWSWLTVLLAFLMIPSVRAKCDRCREPEVSIPGARDFVHLCLNCYSLPGAKCRSQDSYTKFLNKNKKRSRVSTSGSTDKRMSTPTAKTMVGHYAQSWLPGTRRGESSLSKPVDPPTRRLAQVFPISFEKLCQLIHKAEVQEN